MLKPRPVCIQLAFAVACGGLLGLAIVQSAPTSFMVLVLRLAIAVLVIAAAFFLGFLSYDYLSLKLSERRSRSRCQGKWSENGRRFPTWWECHRCGSHVDLSVRNWWCPICGHRCCNPALISLMTEVHA